MEKTVDHPERAARTKEVYTVFIQSEGRREKSAVIQELILKAYSSGGAADRP